MRDAIELLDKHIRYCEDMALDLNDIGGRNADEKAEKFSAVARDLMDVKAEVKRLRRENAAAPDLYETEVKLCNEVGAILGAAGLRAMIGNTNFNVLKLRYDEARAALSKVSQQQGSDATGSPQDTQS